MSKNKNQEILENILITGDFSKENIALLIKMIPELIPMIGFDQKHPHHHLDVFNHTILSIKLSKLNFDVRLALLFHDISKPETFVLGEDNVGHFPNHGNHSSQYVDHILKRLGYEDVYINKISKLVKNHDNRIPKYPQNFSKFIEENGISYARDLISVQEGDALAHNPLYLEKRITYIETINKLLDHYQSKTYQKEEKGVKK